MQPTPSPLDQLADIRLPAEPGWWPLAPGWWLIIALVFCALAAYWWWRKRKQRNQYRLIALSELDFIFNQYLQQQNAADYLHKLSVLLRRTAITAYPHSFNASIKGIDWLHWLDATCPGLNQTFASDVGQSLLTNAYQKNPQVDAAALYQLSKEWIKQHRQLPRKNNMTLENSAGKTANKAEETNHV